MSALNVVAPMAGGVAGSRAGTGARRAVRSAVRCNAMAEAPEQQAASTQDGEEVPKSAARKPRPLLQIDLVAGTAKLAERRTPTKIISATESLVKESEVKLRDNGNIRILQLTEDDCVDATNLTMDIFFTVRPQDFLRQKRLRAEQSERVYQGLLSGVNEDPLRLLIAAKVGDALVGIAEVSLPNGRRFGAERLQPPAPADMPYLSDVAVAPTQRGRGVGRELVKAAEAAMKELGYNKMYLHTKVDNEGAQKLFGNVGYVEPSDAKANLTAAQIAQRSSKGSIFAKLGFVETGHLLLARDL